MLSTFLTLALSCSLTADIQPPTTPDGLLAAMKAGLLKLQEAEGNMGRCKCVFDSQHSDPSTGKQLGTVVKKDIFWIARSGDRLMMDHPGSDRIVDLPWGNDPRRMVFSDDTIAVIKMLPSSPSEIITKLKGAKPSLHKEWLRNGNWSCKSLTYAGFNNVQEMLDEPSFRIESVKALDDGLIEAKFSYDHPIYDVPVVGTYALSPSHSYAIVKSEGTVQYTNMRPMNFTFTRELSKAGEPLRCVSMDYANKFPKTDKPFTTGTYYAQSESHIEFSDYQPAPPIEQFNVGFYESK